MIAAKKRTRLFRRWLLVPAVLVFFLALLFLLRYPVLRGLGNYLIRENEPFQAEAIFILSGNPTDRGRKAAQLYFEGYAPEIVCTGENIPHDLEALGLDYPECELTRSQLLRSGVPDSAIVTIPLGASTREEKQVILSYCLDNGIKSCLVVSNRFHTRRIRKVFRKAFRSEGIQLGIIGAPHSLYRENRWWESEYGLLDVNNEYLKLLYYSVSG